MSSIITEWFNSKKKTYHRIWEIKDGYAWCLFFVGDPITGNYHCGVESSESLCVDQIMWSIGTELEKRNLL